MKNHKNNLQLSPGTTKDDEEQTNICSSINTSDKIDLFEGLNLDEICVPPRKHDQEKKTPDDNESKGSGNELFGLNPLDGIDLENLSVNSQSRSSSSSTDEAMSSRQDDEKVAEVSNSAGEPDNSESREDQEQAGAELSVVSRNSLPLTVRNKADSIDPVLDKAYSYAELTQIREILFAGFKRKKGNILLVASPHDNTGTSLLVAALGYNVACSCQKSVLLFDCNMRRAGLHKFFHIPQGFGFTEIVQNNLSWQAVVKSTGFAHLQMITAGSKSENFSDYICDYHVPNLINEVRDQFDLIIVDTSPVLAPNRNNVNIVSLTSVVDYFLLVINKAGTTRNDLQETQSVIEAGNGRIDAIVLNEHDPVKKKKPFQKS